MCVCGVVVRGVATAGAPRVGRSSHGERLEQRCAPLPSWLIDLIPGDGGVGRARPVQNLRRTFVAAPGGCRDALLPAPSSGDSLLRLTSAAEDGRTRIRRPARQAAEGTARLGVKHPELLEEEWHQRVGLQHRIDARRVDVCAQGLARRRVEHPAGPPLPRVAHSPELVGEQRRRQQLREVPFVEQLGLRGRRVEVVADRPRKERLLAGQPSEPTAWLVLLEHGRHMRRRLGVEGEAQTRLRARRPRLLFGVLALEAHGQHDGRAATRPRLVAGRLASRRAAARLHPRRRRLRHDAGAVDDLVARGPRAGPPHVAFRLPQEHDVGKPAVQAR